jgi:hypothetical protein
MQFYEELEHQLVGASRRLSSPAHAPRASAMRPNAWLRRSRRGALAIVAFVALSGSAIAAVVAVSTGGGDAPGLQAVRNLSSVSGAHPTVKAWGIDPSSARPAFTSPLGPVSVAENNVAACLVISDGQDRCFSKINIDAGRGFSIANDCSAGSARTMTIDGFLPAAATQVEVAYSDGSSPLRTEAVSGAYVLTGRTPAKGQPYPVALRYLANNGSTIRSAAIPDGDDLCLTRAPAAPPNTP